MKDRDLTRRGGLRRIATGVAAKHMKPDDIYLDVHVTELISDFDKVYSDDDDKKKPKKKTVLDSLLGGLERGALIKCRHYNSGSNTISAPTVRRGETVEVYQYGDTDQYFWRPTTYETDVRGTESTVTVWSNIDRSKKSNHLKKVTKDTSYYTVVDTKNKRVRIRTNKNDGEPAAWDIDLNTGKGLFRIENSSGDYIKVSIGKVEINTKTFILNGDEVTVNGKTSTKIKTAKMGIESPDTKISGGKLTIQSDTSFEGTAEFLAAVAMNMNAETTDGAKVM